MVSYRDGDTIVELIYDRDRSGTSFVVSKSGEWERADEYRTAAGELLVPYSSTNNLISHGCVVLPSEPVLHGDKASLLQAIESYLHRYVDLSPMFERLAAHYALLTWVYDAFNELPYLRFQGDYGSGKTRALIALGSITYKGFFASGASTVSPIFHTLDSFGGTLLLDEADLSLSDKTADLVKILNNGTVRGLPVLRTLTNRHREFNPAAFTVYGPKIIAMRGSFRDPALESRFLTETVGLRPLRPDVPFHLPRSLGAEALDLRNKLLDFRLKWLDQVMSDPSRTLPGIGPRLNQTALSLLSIIDDAGLRDEIAQMLGEQQMLLAADRLESPDARVVAAAWSALKESVYGVPLRDIAKAANAGSHTGQAVSAREAGQILRGLGVSLRKSRGLIVVPKEHQDRLKQLAGRYTA